jgi:murein DD-endopeptidase MepM/ murein hydrolase activator NlpD
MICFFPAFCDKFPVSGYRVNVLYILFVLFVSLQQLFGAAAVSATDLPDLSELVERSSDRHSASPLAMACRSLNDLNTRIRDGKIRKDGAQSEIIRLLAEVRDEYYRSGGGAYQHSDWVFPLSGHDARAVARGRQHGFVARGYDFFKGNRHGGHPSYDIFIHDRNQDSLDDASGKPVKVLSLTGGVIVALEDDWEPGSRLRGGRYIWVYDPANDLLVYYAHNGGLSVELGEVVKPGDVLATVGRSGWNAAKKRSPTHLHLTVLRVRNGTIEPLKVYRDLVRSRSVSAT